MVWYLAQRGKDADTKFLEYFQKWDDCPLSVLTGRMQKGKGSICMPFVNGSRMQPSAQVADAGHGYQGDLIDIDEAWSLTAEQGKTLLDGFVPTTITRQKLTGHRPQILVTSTEGDITSTFYNQLLDQCRSGDMPKRWAFFDWGIPSPATIPVSVTCSTASSCLISWTSSGTAASSTRAVGRERSGTGVTWAPRTGSLARACGRGPRAGTR